MQLKNILLLLASALFVFACSSTPESETQPQSSSIDLMQKGFLLSLPRSEGWTVVETSDYKVLLTKKDTTGSYTIQTLVVSLPSFGTDDKFLKYIKGRMAASQKNNSVIEHDTTMYKGNNEVCVQHNSKENRTSQSGNSFILEVVSFTCKHPDNENAGVYLALSKTYREGASNENLLERATKLLNQMYFTEL